MKLAADRSESLLLGVGHAVGLGVVGEPFGAGFRRCDRWLGADRFAIGVGERQPGVGVAMDVEEAVVVGSVVGFAGCDEVGGIGGAAVLPVDAVVDLQAAGGAAAWYDTAAVASEHDTAEPVGDRSGLAAQVDRAAVAKPDGDQVGVTEDLAGDGVGSGSLDPSR